MRQSRTPAPGAAHDCMINLMVAQPQSPICTAHAHAQMICDSVQCESFGKYDHFFPAPALHITITITAFNYYSRHHKHWHPSWYRDWPLTPRRDTSSSEALFVPTVRDIPAHSNTFSIHQPGAEGDAP